MQENLIEEEKEKFVPEYIIDELSGIVDKQQRCMSDVVLDNIESIYFDIYRRDPESFQKQQMIQKYPGNIKEAKQKSKNMTIKQIYMQKRSLQLDWLFVNIYKERYILEEFGLGVPLLFTMMKMTIIILYILFFINLYTGFSQFNTCTNSAGCYSNISGGIGVIDIISLPNVFVSSASFIIWMGFSYFLKFYINRICEEDDEYRSSVTNKTDQILLKHFERGLNHQQIEQVLSTQLNEFCKKINRGSKSDMQVNLLSVTPVKNFYEISNQLKKVNKLYMKIIKIVHQIDKSLFIPQIKDQIDSFIVSSTPNAITLNSQQYKTSSQRLSDNLFSSQRCLDRKCCPQRLSDNMSSSQKQLDKMCSSQRCSNNTSKKINHSISCQKDDLTQEQIKFINKVSNLEEICENQEIHQQQQQQQQQQEIKTNNNSNDLQQNEEKSIIIIDESFPSNELIKDDNDRKEEQNNKINKQNNQISFQNNQINIENNQIHIEDNQINQKNSQINIESNEMVNNSITINEYEHQYVCKLQNIVDSVIKQNYRNNPLNLQNDESRSISDWNEQKSKRFENSKQFLYQDHKKIKKVKKLLDKYLENKNKLQEISSSPNTLSTSYIIKCQSIQQRQMIQIFLTPQSSVRSFFQKLKYAFASSKDQNYHLNRIDHSKSTHLNINWKTIGISFQKKLKKQTIILIAGTLQFLLSIYIMNLLYSQKLDSDYSSNTGSYYYLNKFITTASQSVFYLVSEKLYEFYSDHMVASLKSKRIYTQMRHLFFFYSLSYIAFPITAILLFSFSGFVTLQNSTSNKPVYFIQGSPFKLFISSYLLAFLIFGLKSYIPLKWVISQLKQQFYKKSKRYMKKTQYEVNKIFKKFKFRLQDSSMSFFNIVLISVPITFFLPILLIVPVLLLTIQYFAYKYHYLVVLRPIYYCKSIHLKTSRQIATYIQRISFLSYIVFSPSFNIMLSGLTFYFVVFCFDIVISIYYKSNYKEQKVNPMELINSLESQNQIQKRNNLNYQLKEAVESYQTVSQFSIQSNLLLNNFQFNKTQPQPSEEPQNTTNLDEIESQRMSIQNQSQLSGLKGIKKQLYSFEQAYNKYKLILQEQQNFHCSS